MTKPNERPGWMNNIKNPYPGFPDPAYCNPCSKKDWFGIGKFYGWEEALDAVLKAADEHGIVFVRKSDFDLVAKLIIDKLMEVLWYRGSLPEEGRAIEIIKECLDIINHTQEDD